MSGAPCAIGHVYVTSPALGTGKVHEERRHEHVHSGAGETVQQLDRRAGARRGAAPVAVGQRVRTGAQHAHVVTQTAQQRVEERQRVDEVVRVRKTEHEAGWAAARSVSSSRRRPQQLVTLAVRVGRLARQLVAGRRDVVVLRALAAAHDLAPLAEHVDLRHLQVAGVAAVAVAALELPAARDRGLEQTAQVDGERERRRLSAPAGQQSDADGAHGARVGGTYTSRSRTAATVRARAGSVAGLPWKKTRSSRRRWPITRLR